MKKLLHIFLTLGATIILFIGMEETMSHSYYFFLRLYIFLYSIYLFSKTKHLGFTAKLVAIFFCTGIAIIFNPFLPFVFSERVWQGIDMVLIPILGFLLIMNIEEYIKSLSEKGNLVFKLIKYCFIYFIVISIPIGVFIYIGMHSSETYHDFMFITRASIANGFIIASDENEQYEVPSQYIQAVGIEYVFTTKDGRKIIGSTFVSISEPKYFAKANVKPIPIEVEYIPSNPKVNYIKGVITRQSIITDFVLSIVAVVLLLLVFGVLGINAFKEFLSRFNEIRNEINNNAYR